MKYNEKEIIKDKNSGMKIKNILKKHNIKSVKTIYDIVKRNGKKHKIPNKKYNVNENYFDMIDTEEKSYWLGFLYADGYVRLKNGRSGELRLKLKKDDKNHIKLFKTSLKSTHKIKDYISKVIVNGKLYESEVSTFSIYNTYLVKSLFKQGCINNKTFILKFPKLNDNFNKHFIRGYFDGDGCTKNYPGISIVCASFDLLNGILFYLNKQKLNLKIYKRNNFYTIEFNNKIKYKRFYDYLYGDSSIYLERKKAIFEKIINVK